MRRLLFCFDVLVLATLLLEISATAQSAGGSVAIGGTVLRLGDPKARVVAELAKDYDVQPASGLSGDLWLVKGKKEPTTTVYAAISFDKGLLVVATKYWLPENRVYSSEDVVLAVYGIIDGFIKQGNKTCAIKTDEHNSPGPVRETKAVFVRCGPEFLEISLDRLGGDSVAVEVLEVLTDGPDPRFGNF